MFPHTAKLSSHLRSPGAGAFLSVFLGAFIVLPVAADEAASASKPAITDPAATRALTDNSPSSFVQLLGHRFVEPRTSLPLPRNEAERAAAALRVTSAAKTGKPVAPGAKEFPVTVENRTRGFRTTARYTSAGFTGQPSIFQYTNTGMPTTNNSCGQAAIATILTYYRVKPQDTGYTVVREIYSRFGPDIAGGIMGTSWQRMGSALRGYGVPANWYGGEAGLKNAISLNKPCLVMLDVGAMPEEGWKSWGGHWVVAYGYDNDNVYLTNWNPGPSGYSDGGKCSWAAFRKGWNTWLTQSNGTPNMFLCPNG